MAAATAVGVASLLVLRHAARRHAGQLWLVALVVLLPVSELAINLLNLIVTSQVPPRPLPKLAMREGIPATSARWSWCPPSWSRTPGLQRALDDLEVRFLGNRDRTCTSRCWPTLPMPTRPSRPGDEALLEAARAWTTS
jgi:cyclic beta-1,2-glucan synthetase